MFTLNNKKPLILAVVAVVTFALFLSPTLAVNDVMAKDKKNKGNDSDQDIDQGQSSRQNAQCVSGEDVIASCNNLSVQDQDNDGNNAAGQQNGKGKGNDSDQEIEQEQESKQNSQCVAGGSIAASCNNLSVQDQDNDGNNAAGQQNGGDNKKGKGNDGGQEIDQDQDNKQNAQCVSGEDAIVSCNNLSFQEQINSGNNALGQD
jgi:succinate dehydrogenase/fumarate reductase-like Fe-S protein